MKNSKSAFIALAFVLGIGGAFASKAAQAKPTGEQWYVFKGNQSQIDDLTQYDPSPTDPGCTTGAVRCAVLALPNPTNANQPDLAHISQEERKN